ncbi:hypothetical protein QYE76_051493 [Lolium multiflorum]|uniref:Transposase (putative) gypsy type domain-containing protein n=1 Tax=Lolium multiflorum TaxID=4521 RepID=A0AAD8SSW8_LOLMU|nr:hypothetical protein QYE76_051493 [Lolium multiflorum]
MENYSLLMGAAVMKMAVEMAAVSMEKPSGALPRSGVRNGDSVPGSWLRDGGGSEGFPAARQILIPTNYSPEIFNRRHSKALLDLSCSRLIGKSLPLSIRGHAGALLAKSRSFLLAGVTGNRHAIAGGPDCSGNLEFQKDSSTPKPEPDEHVFTKAWVERGLSLPPSEIFLSVLNTYGLQPHNICPNSYLLLSNFVTLYKGHLGIRPDVRVWQFFFRVKKETKDKAMVNCGSMTFMLRPQRMFPALSTTSPSGTGTPDGST